MIVLMLGNSFCDAVGELINGREREIGWNEMHDMDLQGQTRDS
jgi:hypothetical protein